MKSLHWRALEAVAHDMNTRLDLADSLAIEIVKTHISRKLRLPAGAKVFLGPYRDSFFHRIAKRSARVASKLEEKKITRPASFEGKIVFYVKDGPAHWGLRVHKGIKGPVSHPLDLRRDEALLRLAGAKAILDFSSQA